MSTKCEMLVHGSETFIDVCEKNKTKNKEYLRDLRCEMNMAYKCKYWSLSTKTLWALYNYCTISKVICINTENKISL